MEKYLYNSFDKLQVFFKLGAGKTILFLMRF